MYITKDEIIHHPKCGASCCKIACSQVCTTLQYCKHLAALSALVCCCSELQGSKVRESWLSCKYPVS